MTRHYKIAFAIIFIAITSINFPTIAQISSQNTPISPSANASARKESSLPTPTDLRTAAQAAQRQGQPLVILLSLPGCPWCELLRRNYLSPMRHEGLHAFQWNVQDRQQRIINFQGQASSGAQLSQAYRYQTTPTVLFLNAQGEEVAPRIEGVASVDLIGAVLDGRVAQAREQIKARK